MRSVGKPKWAGPHFVPDVTVTCTWLCVSKRWLTRSTRWAWRRKILKKQRPSLPSLFPVSGVVGLSFMDGDNSGYEVWITFRARYSIYCKRSDIRNFVHRASGFIAITTLISVWNIIYYIEIQQEIAKESSRYIRHALRHPTATPPKVASLYVEVDRIGSEKIALAQRIVDLMARTRTRLDVDLARVGVLQGEIAENGGGHRGGSVPTVSGDNMHRSSAMAISESLKQVLVSSDGGLAGMNGVGATVAVTTGGSVPKSEYCLVFSYYFLMLWRAASSKLYQAS